MTNQHDDNTDATDEALDEYRQFLSDCGDVFEDFEQPAPMEFGFNQPHDNSQGIVQVEEPLKSPDRLAKCVLDRGRPIVFWRGEFFAYARGIWAAVPMHALKAWMHGEIKSQLDDDIASGLSESDDTKAIAVTQRLVSDVIGALASQTLLSEREELPTWLNSYSKHDPRSCIATKSGILLLDRAGDVVSLMPTTPNMLTLNALPYGYEAKAKCPKWRAFLDQTFEGQLEAVEALQLWFGYCLLPDTSQQKIAMFVGPKRSGKGTIARILKEIVGARNFIGPTLGSLAGPFGLQPLLDRTVACISDARLSRRADTATIVERLLAISGEDAITVDRKHKESITTTLPIRFVLISNELPRFDDSSGAIASRMIPWQFTTSHYGNEDIHLTEKLLAERAGILNWSLEGLRRLRQRGRLMMTPKGESLMKDLERITSPMSVFVEDCCTVGPEHSIACDCLFDDWSKWCDINGLKAGSKIEFGRKLASVVTRLSKVRRGSDGNRQMFYDGLTSSALFASNVTDDGF